MLGHDLRKRREAAGVFLREATREAQRPEISQD